MNGLPSIGRTKTMSRPSLLLGLAFASLFGLQDAKNERWSGELSRMLSEFFSCQDKADDKSPCNRFVGRALKEVYNVDDFGPDVKGDYLDANGIAAYIATSEKWALLGTADN